MSYHQGMGAPVIESTTAGPLVVIPRTLRRALRHARGALQGLGGVSGGPRGNRVSLHAMGDANLITGTILDPNTWNNVPAQKPGLSPLELAAYAIGGLAVAKLVFGKRRRR